MRRVTWGSRFNRENIHESESENGINGQGMEQGKSICISSIKWRGEMYGWLVSVNLAEAKHSKCQTLKG